MAEITQLSELQELSEVDFADSFANSLDSIFKWTVGDINNILNERSFNILSTLRSNLSHNIKETFPQLISKVSIERRAKHLVIKDIVTMGESLAKSVMANDLEKTIFCKSHPTDGFEAEALDSGNQDLSMVVSLLQGLQSSIASLTTENQLLTIKIDTLMARKCNCQCPQANHTVQPAGGSDQHAVSTNTRVSTNDSDNIVVDTSRTEASPAAPAASVHNTLAAATPEPPKTTPSRALNAAAGSTHVPKKEVYIGNVDIKNSCKDIAIHLESHGIKIPASDVRLLKQREDASSYCAKVPQKDFTKATDSSNPICPVGIKFRPFFEKSPGGLQSTSTQKGKGHGRPTRKFQHYNARPFRHETRRQYSPRYNTRNRFLPLQYTEFESDYDEEWPELSHSYASTTNREYYWDQ